MDTSIERLIAPSKTGMQILVLITAYLVLVLFIIGVFDIFLSLVELITSGRFVDPVAVIELLDTVLLLLILVEIHRTLVAYVRKEPVIRTVVGVAIIAIARGIIGFRISEFETGIDALTAAGAFSLLLLILTAAYLGILTGTGDDV